MSQLGRALGPKRKRGHSCAAVACRWSEAVIIPIKSAALDCAQLRAHLLPLLNKGHSEPLTQQLQRARIAASGLSDARSHFAPKVSDANRRIMSQEAKRDEPPPPPSYDLESNMSSMSDSNIGFRPVVREALGVPAAAALVPPRNAAADAADRKSTINDDALPRQFHAQFQHAGPGLHADGKRQG